MMPSTSRTHYDVLKLSQKSDLTFAEVKEAYHQTLLIYHPDKIKQCSRSTKATASDPITATASIPLVDEIVSAYNVLSSPTKRSAYDATLKAQPATLAHRIPNTSGHGGYEGYDLEELAYKEDGENGHGTWSRGCRCGNEQGYVLTEDELDKTNQAYEQDGSDGIREVLVGCRGCSLLIRVTYAVDAG